MLPQGLIGGTAVARRNRIYDPLMLGQRGFAAPFGGPKAHR